jgi:IS30 family transposase
MLAYGRVYAELAALLEEIDRHGLLRQYFPKGTDLSVHSAEDIAAVAAVLNARPRKTLAWKTPQRRSTGCF